MTSCWLKRPQTKRSASRKFSGKRWSPRSNSTCRWSPTLASVTIGWTRNRSLAGEDSGIVLAHSLHKFPKHRMVRSNEQPAQQEESRVVYRRVELPTRPGAQPEFDRGIAPAVTPL